MLRLSARHCVFPIRRGIDVIRALAMGAKSVADLDSSYISITGPSAEMQKG